MGNQNQPKKLNAGNVVIQQNTNQIDQNFENFIKQAFLNGAQNGRLYKDKFNDALAVLENFNIKRLRYTPLGERLFNIFDKEKQNYISEQDFMSGLNSLLKDKELRINYTFRAYDRDGDNKISRKEFTEFIIESWVAAFIILGDTNQENLSNEIGKIFSQLEGNAKRGWIKEGNLHSIYASYDNLSVEVPINLYMLEKNE